MPLRYFRLPADLDVMIALLPPAFEYPENPAWSMQRDEAAGILGLVRTARRIWPVLAVLRQVSPVARDVLLGFVWEESGAPAGMVNVSRDGASDDWFIANVAVLPAYRRRGIARTLVEAAVGLARERKARAVLLEVIAGNTPAYALYTSMGFTRFDSNVQLRHDAPASVAEEPLPAGYRRSPLAASQWQPRYELARRITPAEVQRFRPATEQQFHAPGSVRLLESLVNGFSGIHEPGFVVRTEEDGQVVATVRLSAHTRGTGMNSCTAQLDPAHAALAPYLTRSALRTFQRLSPKNRIEWSVSTWETALLDAARAEGFEVVHESHVLGMLLAT